MGGAVIGVLLYIGLCYVVMTVTGSGYCRCGKCDDCLLRKFQK